MHTSQKCSVAFLEKLNGRGVVEKIIFNGFGENIKCQNFNTATVNTVLPFCPIPTQK